MRCCAMPVPLLPLLRLSTRSLCGPARAVTGAPLHSALLPPSKLPQSVWASKYNDRAYVSTRKVRAHLLPRALALLCTVSWQAAAVVALLASSETHAHAQRPLPALRPAGWHLL